MVSEQELVLACGRVSSCDREKPGSQRWTGPGGLKCYKGGCRASLRRIAAAGAIWLGRSTTAEEEEGEEEEVSPAIDYSAKQKHRHDALLSQTEDGD